MKNFTYSTLLTLTLASCGDTVTNVYSSEQGSGGESTSCEAACNKNKECCASGPYAGCTDDGENKWNNNYCIQHYGGECMPKCLEECQREWEPAMIKCMIDYCAPDDVPECDPYF